MELTKTQKESVEYDSGDLLVKGVPGSGKSVVLMQRALRYNIRALQEGRDTRIVIVTFARSLVKYTDDLIKQAHLSRNMINLMTMDKLCYEVYTFMTQRYKIYIIDDSYQKECYVNRAIQHHLSTHKRHRFHDVEAKFWVEEFKWIKEKNLTTAEQYINAERTGRGGKIRMTKEDKVVAYEFFVEYCAMLRSDNRYEWEDLYKYLLDHAASIPAYLKYDYVLVDEAQDLSYIKLKVAKLLAKRSITVAADKAQKIYNTSFSWKEIGIDIRGKGTKSLDKTFRSTKQIVELAESLLEVNRAKQTDQSEYTQPVLPTREGSAAQIIRCSDATDELDTLLRLISLHRENKDVIGVLHRSDFEKKKITHMLYKEHIPFEEIPSDLSWSITKPGVKLSTLHSSKGLEFDVIIIPFFSKGVYPLGSRFDKSDADQHEEIKAQERSLLYVGMTRAKYDLYLIYSGTPSEFLSEFNPDLYSYRSSDGRSLTRPKRTFTPVITSKEEKKAAPAAPKPVVKKIGPAVKNGSVVHTHCPGSNQVHPFLIDIRKYPLQKAFIGKYQGEEVKMLKDTFVIDKVY